MFRVSYNDIITVNRGDSFEIKFKLTTGDAIDQYEYILTGDDVVYLGIMEPNQRFEDAIIRKKFTTEDVDLDGNIVIRFWPEDTINLLPGKYYYQMKVQTTDYQTGRKDVETCIEKTLFYIQE